MSKGKFLVEFKKSKWFFKLLSVSLFLAVSKPAKLQKVDTAFYGKKKDEDFNKKFFPVFV